MLFSLLKDIAKRSLNKNCAKPKTNYFCDSDPVFNYFERYIEFAVLNLPTFAKKLQSRAIELPVNKIGLQLNRCR